MATAATPPVNTAAAPDTSVGGGGGLGDMLGRLSSVLNELSTMVAELREMVATLGTSPLAAPQADTTLASALPTAPPGLEDVAPPIGTGAEPTDEPTTGTAPQPVDTDAPPPLTGIAPPEIEAGGPAPATTTPPAAVSDARRGVMMIGDSLGVGTEWTLKNHLPGVDLQTNSVGGRSLQAGMDIYNSTADKPHTMIMGLFTNNSPDQIGELRSAIQQTIDDARARGGRVIWATIVRPLSGGRSYDEVNQMMRDMAAANSDAMSVYDWASQVAANPSWVYQTDGIHGTTTGYDERARGFATEALKYLPAA